MNLPAPTTSRIEPRHYQEWHEGSGVDPEIIRLNVISISDLEVDEFAREVERPIAELLNWRITRGYRNYETIQGWWVNGVDPLNGYQRMEWGRFKPDKPLTNNTSRKTQKYASPTGEASRATFLETPIHIWQKISDRCGIEIGNSTNFWQWVWERNVPIVLCEGEKKAGCLLTLGYAAIALPGYRSAARTKDRLGNPLSRPKLIPEIEYFATEGREIHLCFDYETKRKTVMGIRQETRKLGKLFGFAKSEMKIITIPGPEKGVDDFVVVQGTEAFDRVYQQARTLSRWNTWLYGQLTYETAIEVNQDKLGAFSIIGQQPKLICIKSPKGSGKTHLLEAVVEAAMDRGQRVLLITHRVQLGQEICDRVGLNYITELRSNEGDLFGYGVCIDSLHPDSQARFNAEHWQDAIVIVDEAEQVFWHSLDAVTDVQQHRLAILEQLQQLFIQTFQSESGQLILLDADLTDVSINFVLNLAEARFYIKPWILVNRYFEPEKRVCHHFNQSTPKEWLASLLKAVAQGQKVFIVTQSQKKKSTWSANNLAKLILKLFPGKKVLVIDSTTVAEPEHPAYGVVSRLNEALPEYDIVLATPTIETGVSFDVRGHFDSVWGCFWGVTSANSARQALARVRDDIPRYAWTANLGSGKIANGATTKYGLRNAQVKLAQSALSQLTEWWENEDGYSTNESALHTWSEMACRINADRYEYRQTLMDGLQSEGYSIQPDGFLAEDDLIDWAIALIPVDELPLEPTANEARTHLLKFFIQTLRDIRDHEYGAECQEEESEELISDEKGEALKKKRNKTYQERLQYHKWRRHKKYGGIPVTVDLIVRDDKGWYPQLQLAYYLSLGEPYLKERDAKLMTRSSRNGKVWYPTFGRSQIGTIAELYKLLKIEKLQDPNREYSNFDEDMIEREQLARHYADDIKTLTGISICEKDTPISISNKLLKKLDLKLTRHRRTGANGQPRPWMYVFIPPEDMRFDVFEKWYERDLLSRNQSDVSPEFILNRSMEAA